MTKYVNQVMTYATLLEELLLSLHTSPCFSFEFMTFDIAIILHNDIFHVLNMTF